MTEATSSRILNRLETASTIKVHSHAGKENLADIAEPYAS